MISRFARGNRAIVATDTGADDFVMVQWRNKRQPGQRRHVMADFAVVGGVGVVAGLARGDHTIMATRATANHFVVIQRRNKRQPG